MALDERLGDTCGNCHQKWPCGCDDPVRICGICGGDKYDCRCDERSGYDDFEEGDGYDEPFGFDPDEDYSDEDLRCAICDLPLSQCPNHGFCEP